MEEQFETELNDDSVDEKLSFNLENFSGPLDVLLLLIKKSKIEIEDVNISELTDQYLELMKNISAVDMEMASEFIEYAAILIEMKSKKLLPKLDDDTDEDELPEELMLKIQLRILSILREGNEKLTELEDINKFYKQPEKEANNYRIVIKDMQLDDLLDAFTGIMHRVQTQKVRMEKKEIAKEQYTVEQKMSNIKDILTSRDKFKFKDLFLNKTSKEEVVTTFMALLELAKMQVIKINQESLFDEINIEKSGDYVDNGELI